MKIYEDENIFVAPSPIEGLGVFAKRMFKKGEVVLHWNPKRLSEDEIESVSEEERRYINKLEDGSSVLMQVPEKYVNHSDQPNTRAEGESDIATKDISEGEEITSSYKFER